jgi:hypothetical protein
MSRPRFRLTRILAAALLPAFIVSCGGGGGGGGGGVVPPPANLNISINSLPSGTLGVPYNQTVTVTGGTGTRTFAVSAGALPPGLALGGANGVISGTPGGAAGTANFTIMVSDSSTPVQSDSQALSLTVNAAASGRNDTIATATPLGNGLFAASISPSGHPSSVFDPDEDYYRVTTTGNSTVTVDINAQSLGSPLDSVIEIVNAAGARLNTCRLPGSATFNSPCVHDDEDLGVILDSLLEVQVAGAATFYVHVVEWRGDARPDLTYTINISGVN